MDCFELALFAFLVGLTTCGLAGSAMELVWGRKIAFAEPNDALDARREGRISTLALLSCGCTALVWLLALGRVLLAAAAWATTG